MESSPHIQAAYTSLSLNGWFHDTSRMYVFLTGKPFAILMVCIYICASLKIIPQLILKVRVTDMGTEKLISLVCGLK